MFKIKIAGCLHTFKKCSSLKAAIDYILKNSTRDGNCFKITDTCADLEYCITTYSADNRIEYKLI